MKTSGIYRLKKGANVREIMARIPAAANDRRLESMGSLGNDWTNRNESE